MLLLLYNNYLKTVAEKHTRHLLCLVGSKGEFGLGLGG